MCNMTIKKRYFSPFDNWNLLSLSWNCVGPLDGKLKWFQVLEGLSGRNCTTTITIRKRIKEGFIIMEAWIGEFLIPTVIIAFLGHIIIHRIVTLVILYYFHQHKNLPLFFQWMFFGVYNPILKSIFFGRT